VRQQINLYNPTLAPKVERLPGRTVLRVWAVVLVGCGIAWGACGYAASAAARLQSQQSRELVVLQAQLTKLAQQVAARKPDARLVERLNQAQTLLAARRDALARVDQGSLGDTRGVSPYFFALSRQMLDGVWITGLTITGAGEEIVLQGRALDPQLLPTYLTQLRKEDVLRGHGFASVSVQQPLSAQQATAPGGAQAGERYLEFRLASSLRAAEPATNGRAAQ